MRAVVCTDYGEPEVLRVRVLPIPEPAAGEVRIRVRATTAHVGDGRLRRADPFMVRFGFGLMRPRRNLVLGLEVSGTIDALGPGVTEFAIGDEVFAFCGFRFGGNAEFCCVSVSGAKPGTRGAVARKPAELSFAEAAALPSGAMTAAKNLERAGLQGDHRILINGASGSLGTHAIQLSKHLGANVTAVCSGANVELVRSLGADEVVDYTTQDFTSLGARFDVVYDAVTASSPRRCRGLLRPGGVHVRNRGLSPIVRDDLRRVAALAAKGVLRPFVDRIYPMDEVVDAHRLLDTGRKRGSVVLAV